MDNPKLLSMDTPLLEVQDLCCSSHRQMLLNHVSFSLSAGSCMGIAGYQGSGRSLLLQVLAGAIRPSSGSIIVNGYTPKNGRKFYQQIGLVTQKPSLFLDLRIGENIDFISSLKGVRAQETHLALLERLDVLSHLKERLGSVAPGLYQRVALACALLHQPALLLLDDTLYGMDAFSAQCIHHELTHFLANGGTLLWAVHTPQDCLSVPITAWMEAGRLVLLSPEAITTRWQFPAFHFPQPEAGDSSQ